jgi:hypothetical protein
MTTLNGSLTITVVDAKDLVSRDTITKNDPYAVISLGGGLSKGLGSLLSGGGLSGLSGQSFRTKTINGGGKAPQWNESYTFTLKSVSTDSHLHVKVYDSDTLVDDSIGNVNIPLSELLSNNNQGKKFYQLVEKDHSRRIAGYIGLSAKFDIPGMETKSQTQYQQPQTQFQQPQTQYQPYMGQPSQSAPIVINFTGGYPQQGYTQPQQGYTQPQQGYTQPQQSYTQPQQSYTQPQQGYTQAQQGHTQPSYAPSQQSYPPAQAPSQGQYFHQPQQGYTQQPQGFSQPAYQPYRQY